MSASSTKPPWCSVPWKLDRDFTPGWSRLGLPDQRIALRSHRHHRLVSRDLQVDSSSGRGSELASAAGEDRLLATAGPVLARLQDITGESAQVFRRQSSSQVCVATAGRCQGCGTASPSAHS